jgi:hypothetical protein
LNYWENMLEDSSVKVLPSRIHQVKSGYEGLWSGKTPRGDFAAEFSAGEVAW